MIHLHVHSCFSMLSGTARPRQLIERAKALGMAALALTDHGGLYGGIEFYKTCRDAGLQPLLGADLGARDGRAVVLARTVEGYTRLCRLITAFHEQKDFSLENELARDPHNLFILVPDPALLPRLVHLNRSGAPPLPPLWALVDRFDSTHSRNRSWHLTELAHSLGIPIVAGNDVHFIRSEHYRYHVILRAIGEKVALDPDCLDTQPPAIARLAEREAWLKPPAAMAERFSDLPEAIEATHRIAAACNLDLPLGRIEYPTYPVPTHETAYSMLWTLCFEGARQRYQPLTPQVVRRLNYELSIVEEMGLAAYFLIVWDIVRFCRERRIPCVGRGSAADSLVAYVLGITHGCPIEHDLYFERFLNPQRKGAPDIDLDLCWRRRNEVLDYVYRTYGRERVAMIATHATFRARGALRETAKVLGLPEKEIHALIRQVPHFGSVKNLEKDRSRLPETQGLRFDEQLYKSLWDAARFIDGLPRHIGTHACGIVVAPRPLADRAPLQIAPKGLQITQYEMHAVEDLGLLKIDLLGVRSLSVIADVTREAEKHQGLPTPLDGLLPFDEDVYRMIGEARTLGCFQLESPGMRQLLRKLNVDGLNTLIDSISIIRPGPNDAGMMRHYVARKNGKEPVTYLDPRLKPLLESTCGILLYQEDVLKVAHIMAGLSLGEADVFRRAMTKLRTPENMEANRRRFIDGALAQGVALEVAWELWRQVSGFAGYAFCKAHSVSYGILAYQSAWLKHRYPARFMAATIDNGGGFYSPAVYVEEARRLGLRILPPDVNLGEKGFTAGQDWLRAGLDRVKHLSDASLQAILSERSARPFQSLEDLACRARLTRPELESLILCGALESVNSDRRELLWRLDRLMRRNPSRIAPMEDLFKGVAAPPPPAKLGFPPARPLPLGQLLLWETAVLGFTVSAHPMSWLRTMDPQGRWIKVAELPSRTGKQATVAGIVRTAKRTKTRQGREMKFITLEDETGLADIVLFPDDYRRWGRTASGARFLAATGRVMNDSGSLTIEGEHIERLQWRLECATFNSLLHGTYP